MRDRIEYIIVILFINLVKILPISWVYALFNTLASFLYHLIARRRKLTLKNLARAYPELSAKAIDSLAKRHFQSVGITIAEILLIFTKRIHIDELINNVDETIQKLKEYTKDNTKGIIFTTAHYGNWEVLASFIAKHGYPMTAIGRKGNNTLIEENLTTPFRERYGTKNVHKSEAMMNMVKTLRSGGNVGLLIDQKTGPKGGESTLFFNLPCFTTTSVAAMKLKYDPLVITAFARREKDGKYTILLEDPIHYVAEEKESKEEKVIAMTQHYNDILEKVVRSAPEQWFWVHDRWKYGVTHS